MNMQLIHYLSGPLIGAVIGYCTNYVAVKMLFRPHHEVKIGKFRLPFTPGLIPKRKDALAGAIGRAVSESLLTEEDMSSMLLSENTEATVVDLAMQQMRKYLKSSEAFGTALPAFAGEELYQKGRDALKNTMTERIMAGVMEARPGEIIAEEGKKAVQEKLGGSMIGMFLHGDLMDSLAAEVGNYAEDYIREHGPQLISDQLEKEISGLEEKRIYQLGERLLGHEEVLEEKIREIYRVSIGKAASALVAQFHISQIIEDKIKAMKVEELEALVMSVMKHELGMIVNLGALIGFVLGLVNVFI
jgi:uncharacterized membrane protein YheB (UPF0754 family)